MNVTPGSKWVYREWADDPEPPEAAIVEAGRVNDDGSVRDGEGVWWEAEEWDNAFVPLTSSRAKPPEAKP